MKYYRLCRVCEASAQTDVEYGTPYECPDCTPPVDLTKREKKLLTWLEARVERRFENKLRIAEEACLRRNSDD